MVARDEERDDISACTFDNERAGCSGGATNSTIRNTCCWKGVSSSSARDDLPQSLRVVVDAIPMIPSLQLDSVGSQQTEHTAGSSEHDELVVTAPQHCSFRSFTEPPLRRRGPRSCYEEEIMDSSDHSSNAYQSGSDSVDSWYTASSALHQGEQAVIAPNPTFRPRFRTPRFLLRPRRLYHATSSSSSATTSATPSSSARRLIPAEHPLKLLWDFLTVLLSFVHAYATHQSIRDRQFGKNSVIRFCELWFMVDIMLNFFTERHVSGRKLTDYKAVWARYLTSWFVVDILSLVPFELLIVQPIIERQNRRGFFQKSFFRTKAVVRVSHIVLKNGYIQLFGKAARQTKPFGIGANRLLQLLIKYLPKYILFLRNMKAVVAVRVLRQVNWLRKVYHNYWRRSQPTSIVVTINPTAPNGGQQTVHEDVDGDLSLDSLEHHRRLYYDDWELVEEDGEDGEEEVDDDDDDDGDPY